MWSVDSDIARCRIGFRLGGYVSSELMQRAVTDLIGALGASCERTVLDVDLTNVEGFDIRAPIIAVGLIKPWVGRIERVNLCVKQARVRIAALSAARIAGLPVVLTSGS